MTKWPENSSNSNPMCDQMKLPSSSFKKYWMKLRRHVDFLLSIIVISNFSRFLFTFVYVSLPRLITLFSIRFDDSLAQMVSTPFSIPSIIGRIKNYKAYGGTNKQTKQNKTNVTSSSAIIKQSRVHGFGRGRQPKPNLPPHFPACSICTV